MPFPACFVVIFLSAGWPRCQWGQGEKRITARGHPVSGEGTGWEHQCFAKITHAMELQNVLPSVNSDFWKCSFMLTLQSCSSQIIWNIFFGQFRTFDLESCNNSLTLTEQMNLMWSVIWVDLISFGRFSLKRKHRKSTHYFPLSFKVSFK